jgi:hypothetical protein
MRVDGGQDKLIGLVTTVGLTFVMAATPLRWPHAPVCIYIYDEIYDIEGVIHVSVDRARACLYDGGSKLYGLVYSYLQIEQTINHRLAVYIAA